MACILLQKRDARVSFPPFSLETILPLIGQTAHGRMAGIIVLTVWPIRGNFVPHENGGKLTLASLFSDFSLGADRQRQYLETNLMVFT